MSGKTQLTLGQEEVNCNSMKKIIYLVTCIFCLLSCTQKDPYANIPFHYEMKGAEHYEVISRGDLGSNIYDTIQKVFIARNDKKYYDYKLDQYGNIIDSMSRRKIIDRDTFYIKNQYYLNTLRVK